MRYQLVIFDWDGTLMDSTDRVASSMRQAATLCGLAQPSPEKVKSTVGLSLEVAIRQLYPQTCETLLEQLNRHYKAQYRYHDNTPSPLFDGAFELLKDLHDNGYKLAVATGKSSAGLERAWRETNTGSFFNTSRSADQAKSKPSPDMLQQILTELDIGAQDAVMIGDTEFDLEMARATGMDSIGVSFGAHHTDQLSPHAPVAIVDSLGELRGLL